MMGEAFATDDYRRRAIVRDVYDGDTITVDFDLGMHTWLNGEKIRLANINAPEVRGDDREKGLASRDWLRSQILAKPVIIRTFPNSLGIDLKGKYGRWIGEIYLPGEAISVNQKMVDMGLAEPASY